MVELDLVLRCPYWVCRTAGVCPLTAMIITCSRLATLLMSSSKVESGANTSLIYFFYFFSL